MLARRDAERDILQGPALAPGIAKRDTLDRETAAHRRRHRKRRGRARYRGFQGEKGEELGDEARVLINIAQAGEERTQGVEGLLKGLKVHHQAAEGDEARQGLPDEHQIKAIGHHRGQELGSEGAARLAAVNAELLDPQAALQREITAAEKAAGRVQAQLLGRRLVGQQPVILKALALERCVLFAPFEKDIGEMEAEEKGRQQGEQQEQGDRPMKKEEQAYQAGQGQPLLHNGLEAADQLRGTIDGLVLGAMEGVKKVGILVIGVIDLGRLLMEALHDMLLHQGALMLLQPGVDAAGDGLEKDQSRHQGGENKQPGRHGGGRACFQGCSHRVKDELAGIQDAQGQHALQHQQQGADQKQQRRALPDQADRSQDIGEKFFAQLPGGELAQGPQAAWSHGYRPLRDAFISGNIEDAEKIPPGGDEC